MTLKKATVLFLVTLCAPLVGLAEESKPENPYKVMQLQRVIDGDTFVASGKRIRMWGIDAPEKEHPSSWAATQLLKGFLEEGELTCKLVDVDRYERDVMHCLIDGLDVGSMMVQVGMAEDFTKYSGGYYRLEEEIAREKRVGIWRNPPSEEL